MRALSPRPVRTACLMHSSLITGSMPGIAASTSDTCEFGSPPNAVDAPENNFDCEVTWAWISIPTTTSQSPVPPLIKLDLLCAVVIAVLPCQHALVWRRRCHKGAAVPLASSLQGN